MNTDYKTLDELAGINVGKPVLDLKHADLTRSSDESIFQSWCPACSQGLLPVRRDPNTMELLSDDNCLLCGQAVHYTDAPWVFRPIHCVALRQGFEYVGTIHHGDDLNGEDLIEARDVPHKDEDCAWCKALRDRVCSRTSLANRPK